MIFQLVSATDCANLLVATFRGYAGDNSAYRDELKNLIADGRVHLYCPVYGNAV